MKLKAISLVSHAGLQTELGLTCEFTRERYPLLRFDHNLRMVQIEACRYVPLEAVRELRFEKDPAEQFGAPLKVAPPPAVAPLRKPASSAPTRAGA